MRSIAKAVAAAIVLVGLTAPAPTADSALPSDTERLAPRVCGDGPAKGRTVIKTSDGKRHSYYWRVPATDVPDGGRPVLIWLHGDGGDGSAIAPRFWPHTDPDGAIVVTPNGTRRTWNHRVTDSGRGPLDMQFLERTIKQLIGCASVDSTRIFVGGSSRGAYMPYFLLQRKATRGKIAAVAINAGLLSCPKVERRRGTCNADASDPVLHGSDARILHLHGTDDTSVAPPPTASYHNPVDWNIDWRVFYPMKLWAQQSGCWTDEIGGPNNGVLKESYLVGERSADVYDLSGHGAACDDYQLILVTDGGHVIGRQEERIWAFLMDRPAP